jgi:tetraprenyl-beta-curcumene synthase
MSFGPQDSEKASGPAALRERLSLAATFLALALRYWLSIHPRVLAHLRRARARAREIPDPQLRELALAALDKRANLEGAGAFAALAPRRTRAAALRALLAFQSIYNHADMLAEQPAADPTASAARLHLALVLALACRERLPDFHAHCALAQDGGYLERQVCECQDALAALPSIALVRHRALAAAANIREFQAYSSAAPAAPARLKCWARTLAPGAERMHWCETAAAAGSSLAVLALIVAAATPALEQLTPERLHAAYAGSIGALHSMLDSLLDEQEDAAIGQPSLIGLYPSRSAAGEAMGALAARAMAAARALPHGRRHAVLVASMASLYISDPHAAAPPAAPIARAVRAGIGPPARPALAVFAIRRLVAVRSRRRRPAAAISPAGDPVESDSAARACVPAA